MPNTIQPPAVQVSDEYPFNRVRFRLWQIVVSAMTVLITVWFFTLGAVPGIIAAVFAKHILVAVFAAGLRLPPTAPPPAPRYLPGNKATDG